MWRFLTDFVPRPYKLGYIKQAKYKPKNKNRLEDRIDFNIKIEKKNIEIIF
jgi:hypothetical protein|tara:strand:- start:601 stop:753 length:153 start_codon:yes stop_codon:yes gene_type:complete